MHAYPVEIREQKNLDFVISLSERQTSPTLSDILRVVKSDIKLILPTLQDEPLLPQAVPVCDTLNGRNVFMLQLISAVLYEDTQTPPDSNLANLTLRLQGFYRGFDIEAQPNLKAIQDGVRSLRHGLGNTIGLLELVIDTLPSPTHIMEPKTLPDVVQIIEVITGLLELRRRVHWLVLRAIDDGAPSLPATIEQVFQRQTVSFLAQLESACLVADELLATIISTTGGYDTSHRVLVSQHLMKGLAAWYRRVGYPLGVREQLEDSRSES